MARMYEWIIGACYKHLVKWTFTNNQIEQYVVLKCDYHNTTIVLPIEKKNVHYTNAITDSIFTLIKTHKNFLIKDKE